MLGIYVLLIIAMLLVIKFCKKVLKVILSSIVIILAIYCVIVSIDISRVNSLRAPIFCYSVQSTADGSFEGMYEKHTETYYGLGYRVVNNINENNAVISSTMYMFNKVLAGAIT